MKRLVLTACLGFLLCMSGCATSGSGCCGNSGGSIFGQSPFQNRPVRTYFQNLFQGDPCNTCNPPVGIPSNCGTNVAPLCDACGSSISAQPAFGTPISQGVPINQGVSLYGDPVLNAPTSVTTGYPNLTDSVIGNGIDLGTPTGANLGTPTGTIETGYGEIPVDEFNPPIGF